MVACPIANARGWNVGKVDIYFIGVLFALLMLVACVLIAGLGLAQLFNH